MSTYRDLLHDAMFELQVLDLEESAGSAESTFVLGRLNNVLDQLNAVGLSAYVDQWQIYTGSAIAPHSIGPSGTFTVSVRPEAVIAANLRGSTSTISTRTPLTIRDEAWWNGLTSFPYGTPTDLYYRPSYPNGDLNFYPLPSGAFYPELLTRNMHATGTLDTSFSLPPGFYSAVMKMLAVEIAPAFLGPGQSVNPLTIRGASMACQQLLSNHGKSYKSIPDSSLPGSNCGWWDFNSSSYR